MPEEHALVSQNRSHMAATMAARIMAAEQSKGCTPDLAAYPVSLEPPYQAFSGGVRSALREQAPPFVPVEAPAWEDLRRFEVWLAPDTKYDWLHAELFLKQLHRARHRLAWEVEGNRDFIGMSLLCHREDEPLVVASFEGQYPDSRLQYHPNSRLADITSTQWAEARFREYYPPPPYSHLFTGPRELRISPLVSLLHILARVPEDHLGIYQVILAPVAPEHNWHENVEVLLDLEYKYKNYSGMQPYHRYALQNPSADLRGMALDVDQKSHKDKPIYAAVVRTALVAEGGSAPDGGLEAVSAFLNPILHGGKTLQFVDDARFARKFPPGAVRDMYRLALSYRPGFILNSEELASFVNLPPLPEKPERLPLMSILDGFGPAKSDSQGLVLGRRIYETGAPVVYCPDSVRARHGHVIGKSGMGKSMLILTMCLHDIARGHGIAVLDPHGDLARLLLALLPESAIERTLFFDAGDPDWVPEWNPLSMANGQSASEVTGEFVAALKKTTDGWGDRLLHLLSQTICGLLSVGDATLMDVANLFGKDNAARRRLCDRIGSASKNPMARQFWLEDFKRYKSADILPVLHKLGKLVDDDRTARMFIQPENRINHRRIMDEGQIFIADLSTLGPDSRILIGSLHLSAFFRAAMGRTNVEKGDRRPFHIYADEAHQFIAGTMTEIIAQARKNNLSLTLAHQNLSQFRPEDMDTLGSTGFSVFFNVLHKDAERLTKLVGVGTDPGVLSRLPEREALVRVDRDWARIRTLDQTETPNDEIRRRAIAASRERYYVAAEAVDAMACANRGTVTACAHEWWPPGPADEEFYFERLPP